MTDRLRRLDALFAQRVLGYTTQHFAIIHGGTASDGWALTGKPRGGDILLPYPRPLPHYTRSLDAAWEGVDHDTFFARLGRVADNKGRWFAMLSYRIPPDDHAGPQDNPQAIGGHPAEALVLACLRACNVSEEELS